MLMIRRHRIAPLPPNKILALLYTSVYSLHKIRDGLSSRNGYSEKTLKTSLGDIGIYVPRDRKGEFEPQLVRKNQTTLSGDIEEKILSMYAKGITARLVNW